MTGARPRPWLSCLLGICAALAAAGAAAQEVAVTGLSFSAEGDDERLTVSADGPLALNIDHPNDTLVMLTLRGAVLREDVPRRISGGTGATLQRAVASVATTPTGSEVRIQVRHLPGMRPLVRRLDRGLELVFAAGRETRAPPRPPLGASGDARSISLAMRDAPLSELIRKVATLTGETILMEAEISNRISVIGTKRYSVAEARAMLDSALLLHGYAAIPMPGGGRKIVPITGAPLPWLEELGTAPGDEAVTTLVRLDNIDAEFMLSALQPLLGSAMVASVEPASNGILLAGSARNIARLRDAMRLLDSTGGEQQLIWALKHRSADEILPLLQEAFPEDVLHASIDARANRLILGLRAERVGAARRFVSQLDRPQIGRGAFHVVRVHNADPVALADQIRELQQTSPDVSERDTPLASREFAVEADAGSHSLVLRADPSTAALIADLVAELDVLPPRVRVHVHVAEFVSANSLQLGFDAFLPVTTPNSVDDTVAVIVTNPTGRGLSLLPGADETLLATVTRAPVLLPIVDALGNPIEVTRGTFAISASDRGFRSQLLMSPELLVSSGEQQEIFIGNNVPILASESGGETTGGLLQTRQNVERHDTGVLTRVTPTVGSEGVVSLELLIEVSSLTPSTAGDVERVGPTISETSIEARVNLSSEEAVVLAFAAEPIETRTVVGVPFLSQLPLLGFLFRSTTVETTLSTLLVTVRAEREHEEALALTELLLQHLEGEGPRPPAAPPVAAGG